MGEKPVIDLRHKGADERKAMKAIIPAAGLGTRFLPATKCTPKEMLPVLDKPVIQYVVEEALEPEEVDGAVIVTSPGKPELLSYFQPDRSLEALLRERGKDGYADAVADAGDMPVDFRYQYEPKGLGHAIRSVADAVAGESFLVLLGDYVVPSRDICTRMLEVSRAHAGASVIAVAPCSPADVSRYGVIAGERVDTLEGFGGVADDEPGAVWRVSGLVEKPAAEEAPSNLYIVGRYLLSPLVMDLLADREPGKGGGPADRRHGPLARARGHVRRRHRPAVRLRHRHPLGLDRDQRPHGGLRPPLRRRVLGGHRRARGIGPSLGDLVQTLVPIRWLELVQRVHTDSLLEWNASTVAVGAFSFNHLLVCGGS